MIAPVTVVIPTLNAADTLGPCLGALGEALFDGVIHEVILADGGSSDGIEDIADQIGAKLIQAPRGRGSQLDAGAKAASAPWLLFLHADTVLEAGWGAAVLAHIADHPGCAAWFRLSFDVAHRPARMVAGWANLRSRWLGLPYGDQGLLVSRALLDKVGGVPALPLMEDVALARRLRGRLRPLSARAVTSAAKYEQQGWFRRGARNLGTLIRYFAGVSPEKLAQRYYRS